MTDLGDDIFGPPGQEPTEVDPHEPLRSGIRDVCTGRCDMDKKLVFYTDAMQNELKANEHKGDWNDDDPQEHARELLYHAAKLVLAVRFGNKAAALEYAADVGNHALMVIDTMAAFDYDLLAPGAVEYDQETGGVDWGPALPIVKEMMKKLERELWYLTIPPKPDTEAAKEQLKDAVLARTKKEDDDVQIW